MGDDPDPSPDPSSEVTTKTCDADVVTARVNISDPVDVLTQNKTNGELPTSPPTPRIKGVLTPSRRDYKVLYEDLKRKTLEYSKNMDAKLAANNQSLKDEIEQLKEKHQAEMDTVKIEYEHIISAKEKLLAEKTAALENGMAHLKRKEDEELFRSKPKRKGKTNSATETEQLKCQYTECEHNDEDALVKCNACGVWVCEGCHNIPITKLKQIMSKCKSVYFACKTCNTKRLEFSESQSAPEISGEKISDEAGNSNLISSIKKMFNQEVSTLESKLESLIDDRFRDLGLSNTSTGEASVESGEDNANGSTSAATTTYAKVLRIPDEVRKAIEEAKNDERVEENEQVRRAKNFIIHGAEEFGENSKEIQEADDDYVKDILKHLGSSQIPIKIMRLGQPNERKKRPIKVIMGTKEAKEKVMRNLNKLKGTEEDFGKLSITEDYTQTEREKIREWNVKAKAKSEQDAEYNYKVRGDPKNGLCLIRVAKK